MKKEYNTPNIFTKRLLIALLLVLQLTAVILLLFLAQAVFQWVFIASEVLAALLGIRILVSRSKSDYKISWLVFILLIPLFGVICYFLFAESKPNDKEIKKLKPLIYSLTKIKDSKYTNNVLEDIDKEKDSSCYNIAKYINDYSLTNIYSNTATTYYSRGEDAFPEILNQLSKAKHYIFMEYYIIAKGRMWDNILSILKDKVKEGVDVRIIYDDLGSSSVLPNNKYFRTLRGYGIRAYPYSPLKPILDVRMNNRDHRKILIIDGHTAFTGGINLADEYINEKMMFGYWKDNCIMLQGDGVFAMTSLFLSTWIVLSNDTNPNFFEYLPSKYINEANIDNKKIGGYVQPYGSIPFDNESVGENVYLNLISKAKKSIYITTPYFVLDDEMRHALCLAAKNGLDVRIVVPGIPDKKMVYELTKANFLPIIEAGGKIYLYKPGFIHSKTFLIDDEMANVGTLNLDYRSLYLNMENATFLYKTKCISEIKKDFEELFKVSKIVSRQEAIPSFKQKLVRYALKIAAPLF